MLRIDLMIFGYCKIKVPKNDLARVSNLLLKNNISVKVNSNGEFVIPYFKKEKTVEILKACENIEFSEPKGLFGLILKNRKKFGVFLGLIFVGILLALSSDVVWDVRLMDPKGNNEQIISELESAGLSCGKRWSEIDTGEIEVNLLQKSETFSWLNINRRGGVAYIKFELKNVREPEEKPSGYANIVASRDCVIEEIIVKSGYPMVKNGESVKKGQILISGVIPSEFGGGICYAEGEVRGRYSDKVLVSVGREKEEKIYDEDMLSQCNINFFGLNLNIYKRYRQFRDDCDIIEEKEYLNFGKKLPIGITKSYIRPYSVFIRRLSDDEMVEIASEMMREQLYIFLSDKEARRLSVSGEFFEGCYVMRCDTIVTADVVKVQEFYADLE